MALSALPDSDADTDDAPVRGAHCLTDFSVKEARQIVADLFEPKPWIYWTDFLLSMGFGFLCYRMVLGPRFEFLPVWAKVIAFFASCILFYRAALFIHEVTHFRTGTFKWFRIVWNTLCGIPLLIPTFLYYTHMAHHVRKHYGTLDDGEYLPLSTGPRRNIVLFVSECFVAPLLVIGRFMLLTPIAWISPRVRRLVQQRLSSMVIDPRYVRPLPTTKEIGVWRLQEAACCLFTWLIAGLIYYSVLPITVVIQAYLTGVTVLFMNNIRTLGAHRYLYDGREVTFVEQLVDSVNYPNQPLMSEIWAPVGLRFHALHHLFASLPYHNLGIAHRRLMRELPPDSPYRLTESPSLFQAIRELWQRAGDSRRAVSP